MKKVVFLLCLLLLSSCYRTDSGLPGIDWNGNHADKPFFSTRYDRERKAYYDKETPEQKALREENDLFCTQLAELPENRAKGGLKMDMIFDDCMKERGSPLF